MKIHRRSLVLASLIIALSTAVYLNWQFSGNTNPPVIPTSVASHESEDKLGEARFVNANSQDDSNSDQSENTTEDSKQFFEEAVMNRQKARDEAIEVIKNTLENGNSSEEAKAEAIKQTSEIAANIQRESNIENLIKAKGYSDCIAMIQNGECNVILPPKSLDDSTAVAIFDVVHSQTGFSSDKIKIVG